MRRAHKLKPNKSTSFPRHIVFFDTEAYLTAKPNGETVHTFRLGYAIYVALDENAIVQRQRECVFYTPQEFLRFLNSLPAHKQQIHIIAHNVSYDAQLLHLPTLLEEDGWKMQSFYTDGKTVVIPYRKKNRRLKIEDGLNRLRGSIKEIGEMLGIPKLEVDHNNVTDEALLEYCKRDVQILKDATLQFIRFVRDHDLGRVAATIAGQAFNAYRHRLMPERIYIHDDGNALELERAAYKGGLVRVFRVTATNTGRYYQLDVNSMYPYVMLSHKYPVRLIGLRTDLTLEKLAKLCVHGCVIARLTVRPSQDCFPHRHNGISVYPLYTFTDVFTTPEVLELIQQDAIVEIHEVAIYRSRYIFREYVKEFYNLRKRFRKEGNGIYAEITKGLLNHLYGKFGAMNSRWKRAPDLDFLAPAGGTVFDEVEGKTYFIAFWGGMAFKRTAGDEAYHSFPAIAAHVTAYARLYLWSLIQRAGRENVFYSDTDSLILNREGYKNLQHLINPTKLGALKREITSNLLIVMGRKDYVIGSKVVRKGVKVQMCRRDPTENFREVWPTLLTYPKRKTSGDYTTSVKPVKLQRTIHDGIIQIDGTVTPFREPPTVFTSSLEFLQNNPLFHSLLNP